MRTPGFRWPYFSRYVYQAPADLDPLGLVASLANASALRFGKLVVAGSGGYGAEGDYDFALARYRLG